MDAQIFWKVIRAYNMDTGACKSSSCSFSWLCSRCPYTQKAPWAAKFALGIANLWIGLAFSPVMDQNLSRSILRFRSICSSAFCSCMRAGTTERIRSKSPTAAQALLLLLWLLYPLVSLLLGNAFPQMVTYYALSHCQSEHHGLCGLPAQEQASPCSSDSLGADWD